MAVHVYLQAPELKNMTRDNRIACFDKENTIPKALVSGVRLRNVS